ncbi:MAG: hypothetical protein JO370_08090, partial [Paucibacter sp.]|nr:hypothetical protein [Roseateles sp.]
MAEQDVTFDEVVAPKAEIPESLAAALRSWAEEYAHTSGAGTREALAQSETELASLRQLREQLETERAQALATLEERDEAIERLTVELRNFRQVASDALVGKAKDQLAIDGKDAQIADLRNQLDRSMASAASESDARLKAQMDLVGATTARDNFEAEIKDLRAQLDAAHTERRTLKT